MKLEVDINLKGEDIYKYLQENMKHQSCFDEPEKLIKFIELFLSEFLGYDDETDYYKDMLNEIIAKIELNKS